MKKTIAAILALSLLLCLLGCGNTAKLTIDTVKELAKKGDALMWGDFEKYPSEEIGFGLYILLYNIDENFDLMIGGVPDEKPMYIRLVSVENSDSYIDIRYEDVDDFISISK